MSITQTMSGTAPPATIYRLRLGDISTQLSSLMARIRNEGGAGDQVVADLIVRYEESLGQLLGSPSRDYEQIAGQLAAFFAELLAHNSLFACHQNNVLSFLESLLPQGVSAALFLQTAIVKGEEKRLHAELQIAEVAMRNISFAKAEESDDEDLESVIRAENMAKRMAAVENKQLEASSNHMKAQDEIIQRQEARFRELEGRIRALHVEIAILEARITAQKEMFALFMAHLS